MRIRRLSGLVLLVLLLVIGVCPAPSAGQGAVSSSFREDFEDSRLEGWQVPATDRPFLRIELTSVDPLSGGKSLHLIAAGWDTTHSREQVRASFRLPRPVSIDSSSVISWVWRVADTDFNDGLCLHLGLSGQPAGTPQLAWASHSNRQRGDLGYGDPEGRVVRHSERILANMIERFRVDPGRVFIADSLMFDLWFPVQQEAWIDDIVIGSSPSRVTSRHVVPAAVPSEPRVVAMDAADWNGDGRADYVLTYENGPMTLFLGRTGGTPAPWLLRSPAEAPEGLSSLIAADLNLDGRMDLAGLVEDSIVVLKGRGQGKFAFCEVPRQSATLVDVGREQVWCLQAGDVSGDGRLDLLPHRIPTMYHDTLLVQGPDWSWAPRAFPAPSGGERRPSYRYSFSLADVDRDHRLDLFGCNTDLYLRKDAGLECVTDAWLPGIGTHQTCGAFGDIDNDGDLDLLVSVDIRRHRKNGTVTHTGPLLYINQGDHFVHEPDRIGARVTPHGKHPVFEDFDLDGDLDLFLVQDHQWEPPVPGQILRNVYLENDGSGRLMPVRYGWISETPAAVDVRVFDADGDGDPDLLLLRLDSHRTEIVLNPSEPPRPPVIADIRNRHGTPDASGAWVELWDSAGRRAGTRQSGVGSMLTGWSEAVFGCPTNGPFRLAVTYPSCVDRPVVLEGLRPGARVRVIEPAWRGPLGAEASVVWDRWRLALGRGAAASGIVHAVAAVAGFCAAAATAWVRRHRKESRGATKDRDRDLLEAIDGFSHAGWARYLASIASLSQGARDGGDPCLVLPILKKRIEAYDAAIRPQLDGIVETLSGSSVDSSRIRAFSFKAHELHRAITSLRNGGALGSPDPDLLFGLARAAIALEEEQALLFDALARIFRSRIDDVLPHAAERVRSKIAGVAIDEKVPSELPQVFCDSGVLANILENVISNAAKAAVEAARHRPPRVSVEVRLEGGLLQVVVRDSGMGISRERLEDLFVAKDTGPGATGRGLPYARRHLGKFDGRIAVVSTSPETGTEFAVTLRALRSTGTPRESVSVAEPAAR